MEKWEYKRVSRGYLEVWKRLDVKRIAFHKLELKLRSLAEKRFFVYYCKLFSFVLSLYGIVAWYLLMLFYLLAITLEFLILQISTHTIYPLVPLNCTVYLIHEIYSLQKYMAACNNKSANIETELLNFFSFLIFYKICLLNKNQRHINITNLSFETTCDDIAFQILLI